MATQLRAAVDATHFDDDPSILSSATVIDTEDKAPVVALNTRLQSLLISDILSHRLAAIAAFTALIYTETETVHARAQRAANAVRVLFNRTVPDLQTAAAASAMVGALSDVNTPLSSRLVEHVLANAINIIASNGYVPDPRMPLLSTDRARAAMVITQLAGVNKTPKFVLRYQHQLRASLWTVVWDPMLAVREQGVHGLQAILKTVVLRASSDLAKVALDDAVDVIRRTLAPFPTLNPHSTVDPLLKLKSPSKEDGPMIHGSLCMLGSVLSSTETRPYMEKFSTALCSISLRFQDSHDTIVRKAVAEILPLLVRLDRTAFADSFLEHVHRSTMALITNPRIPAEERGHSLVSLAAIAEQMPTRNHGPMLEDMLRVCRSTLSDRHDPDHIPREAILTTICHLARASQGTAVFEKVIREGLLMKMFSTDFTSLLVKTVDCVRSAVPSLDSFIRGCMVNLVAATLIQGLPDKRTGLPPNLVKQDKHHRNSIAQNGVPSPPSLPRRPSSSSFLRSPGNKASIPAGPLHQRLREKKTASTKATPKDFFKQYPFSAELHRIDSSSSLATKSGVTALEGLVKTPSGASLTSPSTDSKSEHIYHVDPVVDQHNSPCVALKAIVHYEFTGLGSQDFCSFTSEYVIGYVESNSVKVRALAVAASARLMQSAANSWEAVGKGKPSSKRLVPEIQAILAQLVLISVADPSKDVRFIAIRSLDRKEFHPYLLQPEIISTIFMNFYDESLGMRDAAVSLAGTLADMNPAYILPSLRIYLSYLLMILRFDGPFFAKDRREATELIYTLINHARFFLEPYTHVLIESLIFRLEEVRETHESDSALPVLLAIAELGGTTSRIDLKPYREALVPLVVSCVLDVQGADVKFRKASLRALSALVQNTGFVIRPYVEHKQLLPGLLEILRVETDVEVRLETEALLGSLGAVDPGDHKYASLPVLAPGNRAYGRGFGSDIHSRSLFRSGSHFSRVGSQWDSSLTHPGNLAAGSRGSSQHGGFRGRHSESMLESRGFVGSHSGYIGEDGDQTLDDAGNPYSSKMEINQPPTVALFAMGGTRLMNALKGYVPCWARNEFEQISLVGQLDHPFTASQDYYPSLLLDELHKITSNRHTRAPLLQACQAVVNVLKSVGSRCTYFLPEVVPRFLWIIDQLSGSDKTRGNSPTNVKLFIILKLGDIVATAGQSFMPFAFDTILFAWHYLRRTDAPPSSVIGVCQLLVKLRQALGDEFKPVVPSILPPLLSILAVERGPPSAIADAVYETLESFSGILDAYGGTALRSLISVVCSNRPMSVRIEALKCFIRIMRNMESLEVLSSVLHYLVQILAGMVEVDISASTQRSPSASSESSDSGDEYAEHMLITLSAVALKEIGTRAPRQFSVFVPVVAKALKNSRVKDLSWTVYHELKDILIVGSPRIVKELLGTDGDGDADMRNTTTVFDSGFGINGQLPSIEALVPARVIHPMDAKTRLPSGTRVPQSRVHITEQSLIQKWEVEHHFKADDWVKWIEDLGVAMFQLSGTPSFRSCVRISEAHPSFTKQLFNAAFLSCWTYPLNAETKASICNSLDAAISSKSIPLNVLQSLLNLFEFMDHDEKPLPAATHKLAETACRCGALAKAMRYREQDYEQHRGNADKLLQSMHGEEGLISIYEKLGHIESADGTITDYTTQTGEPVQEGWYEKLQRWDKALNVYEEKANASSEEEGDIFCNKNKWETTLGRLRCLNNVGEWQRMIDLLRNARVACRDNSEALSQLALEGKALSVTFDLGRWDEFEDWVSIINLKSLDGCFYKSLLLIKRGKEDPAELEQAKVYIQKAREYLDMELPARVSEGYPRAYGQVVRSQMLVEMEEMVYYLRLPEADAADGLRKLQDVWTKRLRGCRHDRNTWYRLLMTRALVLKPVDNKGQWLEFATMCRKAKLLPMATEALQMLLTSYAELIASSPQSSNGPLSERDANVPVFNVSNVNSVKSVQDAEIKFACIKNLWATSNRYEAYKALETCLDDFTPEGSRMGEGPPFSGRELEVRRILAGEVYSKLSKWGHRLREGQEVDVSSITDPLTYAEMAINVRSDWYKAWHYWASMNVARFECLMENNGNNFNDVNRTRGGRRNGRLFGDVERKHLTHAVQGYFRAINLSGKTRLEDSLKVLTLWFNYGGHCNMHIEFNNGFENTNVAMWLEVVPQIIARLHTPFMAVQKGVKNLLTRIGTEHPQVAVYPLTVAKSTGGSQQEKRSRAAREILDSLKRDHREIVEQAEMVAHELVRVAILWTEMWFEKLDEASKMYFVERDVDGMIDTLLPLHEEIENGAQTACEDNFIDEFGGELHDAAQLCRRYRTERLRGVDDETLNDYITQAWALYTHVFRGIQRQQQGMQILDLAHVSNGLNDATGLLLAVPGTYDPDDEVPVVRIKAFNPQLSVMQSKQRPRKISIIGNNGHEYQFLLKGHEDLRQDERVMQVFGLVNKLFAKSDQKGLLEGVGMKTYSVIALSANAGVIEWVPDCDTMHALVKEYREVRKIVANIEQRVMLRCAPEPERLTLLQKVDLFEYMLQSTGGADLARVLWLKSRNSEMWLDRRTMYAKSLATTSMTGYLLGLGDRHPSNLMIERSSGKVMHIDFGDCFEVAMKREKYPEKVPFRLTRMLVDALEPCGVEGYFRHTAVATLEVLRQKNAKESLMSMMEAFVYDPLIRWKLIGAEELTQLKREEEAAREGIAQRVNVRNTESRLSMARTGDGSFAADISEIVQSLPNTGSLSESVRQYRVVERRRRRLAGQANGTDGSGGVGMATPSGGDDDGEDTDNYQLMMMTPNYEARLRQARVMGDGVESHEKITFVSNERAQLALNRIADKLCGTDYDTEEALSVADQVNQLIGDARNIENLCTLFLGWCAFW